MSISRMGAMIEPDEEEWALVEDLFDPADRGYRGLAALAARQHLGLHIKAPPKGSRLRAPRPIEHAFARLGRCRRLSRRYEGTESGARAWLEVASLAYLFARLRIQPT